MTRTLRSRFWSFFGISYSALLLALLAAFALYPLLGEARWARTVLSLFLTLMMASALWAIHNRPRVFVAGVVLAAGTEVAMIAGYFFSVETAKPAATLFSFMFMLLLAASIFQNVMLAEEVNLNTVFGACCVYLMLGMIWAGVYELIERFQPGSFTLGALGGTRSPSDSAVSNLMYYSFITMTTVGYGDVTPVSSTAKAFAALQGLVGQLYIAIIVARLVGLEVAHRMQGGTRDGN